MTRWRCGELIAAPLGRGESLVAVAGGTSRSLPTAFVDILRSLTAFCTIDEHAAAIARERGLPDPQRGAVAASLADVARAGLLLSDEALLTACAAHVAEAAPPPIELLGILTKDRPRLLRRCVESHATRARAAGRSLRILVLDDTTDASTATENRTTAHDSSSSDVAVTYLDRSSKQSLVDTLVAAVGSDARAELELALLDPEGCRHTTGANRNALLLQGSGRRFLAADDDTVARVARSPEPREGVSIRDEDPTGFWFHESVAAVLESAAFGDTDPIAVHEGVLGRRTADLLARAGGVERLALGDMTTRSLGRMMRGESRVVATACGYAGDSGMGTTLYYLLLRDPDTRARLFAMDAAHRHTRAVLRVAPSITIGESSFFMAGLSAYDGRALLPPFFPVFRNQDGIFAATLKACAIGSIGHLPWAVEHDPASVRTSGTDHVTRQVGATHLADLVIASIRSFDAGVLCGAEAMHALGAHLAALAAGSHAVFEDVIRQHRWNQIATVVRRLEDSLAATLPPEHASDARAWATAARAALSAPDLLVPQDLVKEGGADEARALARRLVGRYGRLLQAWPAIAAAARLQLPP